MTFEQKKARAIALMDSKKMWRSNYAPSSSAYSMAAGYPASAITLYAVLAGHGADGGLMGHFLGMCNVVYLLGAVRNGGR